MDTLDARRSFRIALINLFIVALLGCLLRYKILFALPFLDQKHLLHGHSHFAFSGWITQAIFVLLLFRIGKHLQQNLFPLFRRNLRINLIGAYGMLLSFPVQGYGWASIFFSTLTILNHYHFGWLLWQQINQSRVRHIGFYWSRAAILFGWISSLGAFALAYNMVTQLNSPNAYLASVYWFLHFQYNGWFFFACMALWYLQQPANDRIQTTDARLFWVFAASCAPAYLLSVLWAGLPLFIYAMVVGAAFCQLGAWIFFLHKQYQIGERLRGFLWLPVVACSIKWILQLGSVIPSLSTLAFGFRSIVIGYLHLVLLGVISLFLLLDVVRSGVLAGNKSFVRGRWLLATGIVLNEILLMIQGGMAMGYAMVPRIQEALLAAALLMLTGIAWMQVQYGKHPQLKG